MATKLTARDFNRSASAPRKLPLQHRTSCPRRARHRATKRQAQSTDGTVRSYEIVELSPRATRGLPLAIVSASAPLIDSEDGAAPAAVHAFDHVVVRTADPDAAIALYERGLGIRLALDRTFGDTRMLFFRIGGVTLEIVEDRALGAADALYGLAYRVRDIDAANARLREADFDVSEVREGRKPGTQRFYRARGNLWRSDADSDRPVTAIAGP